MFAYYLPLFFSHRSLESFFTADSLRKAKRQRKENIHEWIPYSPPLCSHCFPKQMHILALSREIVPPLHLFSLLSSLWYLLAKSITDCPGLYVGLCGLLTSPHRISGNCGSNYFQTVTSCCHVELLMCLVAKCSLKFDLEKKKRIFSSQTQKNLCIISMTVDSTLSVFFFL